jgi:hypothetical protein
MKKLNWLFVLTSIVCFSLYSCEEPYDPPTTDANQQYVVEGFIEEGEGSLPTYVLVTKSIPYLSKIGPDVFADIFVKGANIVVNDGEKDVQLNQLCINELPEDIRKAALQTLGLNPDSTVLDICLYVDIFNQIKKVQGGTYKLSVKIGDKELKSVTTIPKHVPITKLRWDDPPGTPNDTFARLWVTISDRKEKDYYRYFTNDGDSTAVMPPDGGDSSFDDAFFNGQSFEFPLNKAEQRDGRRNPDTFGLYMRGDSVEIKWMNMDKKHFDFWVTRDASANRGGPFGSYIRIKTNIEGGLGVWGGYSISRYKLYCPPK